MAYRVTIERKAAEAIFDLKGRAGELRRALAEFALALPERPNSARLSGNVVAYWIGDEHWLVRAPLGQEERLTARFASMARLAISAVQVSDSLVAFGVSGPESFEVMVQATSLDISEEAFPAGSASLTEFFTLSALVVREPDGYAILVERSYAGFIEAALHRAAGLNCGLLLC